MGRTGAGSGPGAVCVGGRDSRRQGQPAAGTVAGGDKDRAGQRMCGAATGRGDNRGNRIRTGRDVVCTGGWRGGSSRRGAAAYDAICGAEAARMRSCRESGRMERPESRGRRTGRGRFGEALRQGWNGPRDPRFPGRAMCPNRAGNGGPWSRSWNRLLEKRLRPGTGSAAGAGRGNGIRTGCRNAPARATHGRGSRPGGYCM